MGEVLPATKLKLKLLAEIPSVGVFEATVRLTGTVLGELEAPGSEMVIVSL